MGLVLPTTGELSGTWGDTVNDYLTKYIDASVAGVQTISGSQTAVTLTTANGAALTQAGSGAAGSAQYMVINCTGNPASTLTITAPASSKVYCIVNGTTTNQNVKIVGAGPTTGVTFLPDEVGFVVWAGTDFVKTSLNGISFGTTGLTPSTVTDGVVTVGGVLNVANGGTGAATLTGVLKGNGTSAFTAAVANTDFLAPTNPTMSGATLNDGYTEEVFAVSGTTPALSPTNGSIQTWTLTGNSTPTAGTWAAGQSMTLMIDDGTAYTVTWTSLAVTWKTNSGNAPTLETTGYTVIQLWKVGSVIYGARVGNA